MFFSFDSHFNAIFPAEQRKRAAEIRTLNQVGRVVADIGERAQKVQLAEAERLFETDGWKAYDAHLTKLAQQAQGSQGEIEKYFVTKMEERRRGIAEQQERISGAERNQTALLRRRDELEAELQRVEPGIGALRGRAGKGARHLQRDQAGHCRQAHRGQCRGRRRRRHAEARQGDRSIASAWPKRDELQRKLTITDDPRLREAQRQRDQASARIVSLKREIATINGDVAKYKGETQTAAQRIKAAESQREDAEGTKIDPGPRAARLRAGARRVPPAAGHANGWLACRRSAATCSTPC